MDWIGGVILIRPFRDIDSKRVIAYVFCVALFSQILQPPVSLAIVKFPGIQTGKGGPKEETKETAPPKSSPKIDTAKAYEKKDAAAGAKVDKEL